MEMANLLPANSPVPIALPRAIIDIWAGVNDFFRPDPESVTCTGCLPNDAPLDLCEQRDIDGCHAVIKGTLA
ncbi:hypothetical protein GCM10007173_27020 [Glutamicibacter ardleyensis]|uniref:Uncharacterized protein n=1 Tax=Glutamicibacter ardleyensis TaxID=225894 RepID=A0ABQ2DT85_9MICC|nr:hypothetical protein GCM10007173_27020 [Glutamicibacter ardleyensis]